MTTPIQQQAAIGAFLGHLVGVTLKLFDIFVFVICRNDKVREWRRKAEARIALWDSWGAEKRKEEEERLKKLVAEGVEAGLAVEREVWVKAEVEEKKKEWIEVGRLRGELVGWERGKREGRAEGKEEGFREGREEGIAEMRRRVMED
ncbi:hypothetical protein CC80DRAFT_506716 [Byssothecium circinans]|uniref:Uncharacterized protein n=1 Tax=Byssothecium circinans TaxID=147558 RepID=A0A6A5TNR6_9PLEO|nr:hypothetical protein CC80DRAFT_506716 [Byssothecium circinans]